MHLLVVHRRSRRSSPSRSLDLHDINLPHVIIASDARWPAQHQRLPLRARRELPVDASFALAPAPGALAPTVAAYGVKSRRVSSLSSVAEVYPANPGPAPHRRDCIDTSPNMDWSLRLMVAVAPGRLRMHSPPAAGRAAFNTRSRSIDTTSICLCCIRFMPCMHTSTKRDVLISSCRH